MPSQFTLPTQRGQANEEQNIQYVAVPADQLPFLTFNEFRGGGSVHIGPARGSLRGRARHGGRGRGFTRNQGENDAYSMDVAPMNIFENQVIPMGLRNLSKSFKPNLAITRESFFRALLNHFQNSRIFAEECQIKSFLKKQHRVLLF